MSTQFQGKAQQRAQSQKIANIANSLTLSVAEPVLPPATAPVSLTVETSGTPDFMTKVKNFFTKPVSAGSKIQYWHVAVGLLVGFVLYVEMVADRKTQRKLKFW